MGGAGSRSVEYLASAATPTISTPSPSRVRPNQKRRPTGFWPGKNRRASDSLTTATLGASARSRSSIARPSFRRIAIVSKKPGATMFQWTVRARRSRSRASWFSTVIGPLLIHPVMRPSREAVTPCTPGSAPTRSRISPYAARSRSPVKPPFVASSLNSSSRDGSNPRCCRSRLPSVRTKSAAPSTSGSESATCAATSPLAPRSRPRRPPRAVGLFSFRSELTFRRVALRAGARPNSTVVTSAARAVKPSTVGSSPTRGATASRRPCCRSTSSIRPPQAATSAPTAAPAAA